MLRHRISCRTDFCQSYQGQVVSRGCSQELLWVCEADLEQLEFTESGLIGSFCGGNRYEAGPRTFFISQDLGRFLGQFLTLMDFFLGQFSDNVLSLRTLSRTVFLF